MNKSILILTLLLLPLLLGGCAMDNWNENPLKSLTDKQQQWFDRTGEHFRFR